jgi:hypothetical protein
MPRLPLPPSLRWYRLALWPHLKPSFIIIGAQKAGTTSLYSYLSEHPCILPARLKEVHYFDYHYQRGMRWYQRRFPTTWQARRAGRPLGARPITGEASPCYMLFPHTPSRIRKTLPDAKLIVLLRNPVDRAFSHFQMIKRNPTIKIPETGEVVPREPLSFEEAIEAEPERMRREEEKMAQNEYYRGLWMQQHSYLTRGLYARQLRHWQQFFPPEQFLIVDSQQLSRNTGTAYAEVLRFLKLPSWAPTEFRREHTGNYQEKMQPETRARLVEYFRPHNEELFEMLGRRFDWNDPQ